MNRRTPSIKILAETFRDLTHEDAKLIRALCKTVDDRDALEMLIADRCPDTDAYARSCYHSPWDSAMWRRTMVLHAIDRIVGTCGVEALGSSDSAPYAPPFEYLNTGDSYTSTLIYSRESDSLFVGCWAIVAERLPQGD